MADGTISDKLHKNHNGFISPALDWDKNLNASTRPMSPVEIIETCDKKSSGFFLRLLPQASSSGPLFRSIRCQSCHISLDSDALAFKVPSQMQIHLSKQNQLHSKATSHSFILAPVSCQSRDQLSRRGAGWCHHPHPAATGADADARPMQDSASSTCARSPHKNPLTHTHTHTL